jgi:hypothetical protein
MLFHEKEEHGKQEVILKLSKKHNNRLSPQVVGIGNYSNESFSTTF